MGKTYGGDVQVDKNFFVKEFLSSPLLPELGSYRLNQYQYDNLAELVHKLLQPLRDYLNSPITVTGGGRPLEVKSTKPATFTDTVTKKVLTVPPGANIDQLLASAGYQPSKTSDHHDFAGVDFAVAQPLMEKAQAWLMNNPATRQVILYKNKAGQMTHIHVAVVRQDKPRFTGTAFVFDAKEKGGAV